MWLSKESKATSQTRTLTKRSLPLGKCRAVLETSLLPQETMTNSHIDPLALPKKSKISKRS